MPEPTPVRIAIADGGGGKAIFPDTHIAVGDSVFWLNQTSLDHQPVYKNPATGQTILWGPPPQPLPPQKTSSQVVFQAAGSYRYSCAIPGHENETGLITVQ